MEICKFRKARTDIDIDVLNSKDVISILPCIRATEKIDSTGLMPHKSGVHFDNIPIDPCTGYASIEYKHAEELGYQKIDILSQSAYKHVHGREHLKELMNREPDWTLFQEPEIVKELSQIKKYGTQLHIWKPTNIDELAMFIAMIRPGKSKCLHMGSWDAVKRTIWDYSTIELKDDGSKLPYFKKPHAYAYSLMIIVQLNALVEFLLSTPDSCV